MNAVDKITITLSLTVKKLIGPILMLLTINMDEKPCNRMLFLMGCQIAGWKV